MARLTLCRLCTILTKISFQALRKKGKVIILGICLAGKVDMVHTGMKISLADLEALLILHPGIVDVAVSGAHSRDQQQEELAQLVKQ
ncbi:hypothetical protein QN277_015901 [Acacia crassicarpa]|uniref:Uncharacterized protein n=1 Tax=Acacia crassicarpa TaxID=499986 RepID=A0AAE1JWA9_9FABA|nr:hypothetical protein QN277_015901 [Acacia crassicarpa]